MNTMTIYRRKAKKVKEVKHLSYTDWLIKYNPIVTKPLDNIFDYQYQVDERKIWTVVNVDGEREIINGTRYCNREGFLICEVEWEANTDIFVKWR